MRKIKQLKIRARSDALKENKVDIYPITRSEKVPLILESALAITIIGYLFYESIWAIMILMPLAFVIYRSLKKKKREQLKWKLNLQFKDALAGMTAALSAGYSVENSIGEALTDLKCVYKDSDLVIREFSRMQQKIQLNATIEQVFFEFAMRSEIDDILNFAWIMYTAKRTGGDLLRITRSTSNMISERIEVNREIQTVVAAKRLESTIMCLVPIGIIVYLKVGCVGFLDPLYHNVAGVTVMSIMLALYAGAYVFGNRLVCIQV